MVDCNDALLLGLVELGLDLEYIFLVLNVPVGQECLRLDLLELGLEDNLSVDLVGLDSVVLDDDAVLPVNGVAFADV